MANMGYYNRKEAERYIDSHTEDCRYITQLIREGQDRLTVIMLIKTDPNLSLFEAKNIYDMLVRNISHS